MPTKSEQMTLDYSTEVFQYYQRWRRHIEDSLRKWLKAYKGWDDVYEQYKRLYGDFGWRSTIYFPIIHANIETLTPKIVMAVAGDPNFVGLLPTEAQDVQYVDPLRAIVFKQWDDMKAFDQCIAHIKNQLIYGYAWSKYGWFYQEAIRPMKVPVINLMGFRMGTKIDPRKVVLQNRPAMRALPIERVYWDPSATELDDCMIIQDRYFIEMAKLKQLAKDNDWRNVDNIDFKATPELREEMEVTRRELNREALNTPERDPLDNKHHRQVEIIESYGYDRHGKPRMLNVMANRSTLLYDDTNPHPNGRAPFLYTKNSHMAGQFTGSSEAEYALPMNNMINVLRNYHIDNVNLSVNGMWKVSTFADIDLNDLVSRPWGVVETNDMEGIMPLEIPKPGPDALLEARSLENDIQTTSGVVDFLKGVPAPGFADTATGIERLVAGANSRFAARIVSTQSNLITEMVRQMIHMNMMNLGDSVAVRMVGAGGIKFINMRMDNIQGDFDIQVKNANEIVSKAVLSQQKLVLYNLFRGDPEINQRELKRTLIMDLLPMAEGTLLMPDQDDLSFEEENLIMSQGGLVIPLPNDNHREHTAGHVKFLQDNINKMDPNAVEIITKHIQAHSEIAASVLQPLGGQVGTQPTSPQNVQGGGTERTGSPNNGTGGGGAAGSIGQLLSAAGGASATQRPG